MKSKPFRDGIIVQTDHSTNVNFGAHVSKLNQDPKAVLFEAPVNDGVYKAMGGVASDQASSWAHKNGVPEDTFDTVSRNRRSADAYDMESIKTILSNSSDLNQTRMKLKNNHPEFYDNMLVRREREMAENINYHIGQYGSPVLVVVGKLHVPKLLELLR